MYIHREMIHTCTQGGMMHKHTQGDIINSCTNHTTPRLPCLKLLHFSSIVFTVSNFPETIKTLFHPCPYPSKLIQMSQIWWDTWKLNFRGRRHYTQVHTQESWYTCSYTRRHHTDVNTETWYTHKLGDMEHTCTNRRHSTQAQTKEKMIHRHINKET